MIKKDLTELAKDLCYFSEIKKSASGNVMSISVLYNDGNKYTVDSSFLVGVHDYINKYVDQSIEEIKKQISKILLEEK